MKHFRGGMGGAASAIGASFLGRSEGMLPQKIWVSKMAIFQNF